MTPYFFGNIVVVAG